MKRSLKRVLVLALVLSLAASAVPFAVFAGDNPQKFPDVPSSHWAYSYIQKAADAGYISGYSDGRFGPNDTVTNAQWAAMITRLVCPTLLEQIKTYTSADAPWYSIYTQAATTLKLFASTGNYRVKRLNKNANEPITRIEMASVTASVFYGNCAEYIGVVDFDAPWYKAFKVNYTDIEKAKNVSGNFDDYVEDVEMMAWMDILTGTSTPTWTEEKDEDGKTVKVMTGKFDPAAKLTRAQAAKVLCRLDSVIRDRDTYFGGIARYNHDEFTKELYTLINERRKEAGKSQLTLNVVLSEAADVRAQEIVEYFKSKRPTFDPAGTVVEEFDYFYDAYAELIAKNYTSPEEVMEGFLTDFANRDKLTSTAYTEVGIGTFRQNGVIYWAVVFTKPSHKRANEIKYDTQFFANVTDVNIVRDKETQALQMVYYMDFSKGERVPSRHEFPSLARRGFYNGTYLKMSDAELVFGDDAVFETVAKGTEDNIMLKITATVPDPNVHYFDTYMNIQNNEAVIYINLHFGE